MNSLWHRKHLYELGKQKYADDMDWVSIIKDIRMLKLMATGILHEKQRQITYFDHTKFLDSDEYKTRRLNANVMVSDMVPTLKDKRDHYSYKNSVSKLIKSYENRRMTELEYSIIKNTIGIKKLKDVKIENQLSK